MKLTKGSRVTLRDIDDVQEPWPDGCAAREYVIPDGEAGTVVGVEATGCVLVVWDGFSDDAGNEDGDGIPYLPTWRLPVWALELVADGPDLALALLDDAIRVEIDGYGYPKPPDGCSPVEAFRHLMGHVDGYLASAAEVSDV